MPAPHSSYQIQEVPLKIVGGVHYGRYPKISQEETWNFIISDGFLVPYAGYKNVATLAAGSQGRGLYRSIRSGLMYAAVGFSFYSINTSLEVTLLTSPLNQFLTNSGDIYIAENNNSQLCITDGQYVYIYNYSTGVFEKLTSSQFPFQAPGYVSFQNGRFIIACNGTTNWVLSDSNDGTTWSILPKSVGSLQTKPDFVQAAVPVPGGGNNLLVFGKTVAELWQDVGAATFPYQRNSTFNCDFGCINASSIASLNDVIVWIGINEQTGPVLMTYQHNAINQISTDGIDFKLGNLIQPSDCTGFLYLQDGHLLYQFTFITDNLSYAYDFTTKEFSSVSDPNLNYHIARQVVYYLNTYFFVALNDGNLYQFDTLFPFADYGDGNVQVIPRIRITPPFRLPTQRYFVINNIEFTMEQGQPNMVTFTSNVPGIANQLITTESGIIITTESGVEIGTESTTISESAAYVTSDAWIYLAISRDGGESFGNFLQQNMNPTGVRKSRIIYQRLGLANDSTVYLKFVGLIRFVVTDGAMEIYQ